MVSSELCFFLVFCDAIVEPSSFIFTEVLSLKDSYMGSSSWSNRLNPCSLNNVSLSMYSPRARFSFCALFNLRSLFLVTVSPRPVPNYM